eukprot:scaffold245069_cov15-Prasinocladus_malaysianus.AAC.1
MLTDITDAAADGCRRCGTRNPAGRHCWVPGSAASSVSPLLFASRPRHPTASTVSMAVIIQQ